MSWRNFDVITHFLCSDALLDVMANFLTSWCTFWRHDALFDVITSKSKSWGQKVFMTSKTRHNVKITSQRQKVRLDDKKCVMTSKSASRRQKVCHDVKNMSWRQNKCHDVNKFVMMSKSALWCKKVRHKVTCHDFKKFSMTSKTRHDIKCVVTSKSSSWRQKVCQWCQKVRHDIKNTSWRQRNVITSKTRHEVKKCIMTSWRTFWRHDALDVMTLLWRHAELFDVMTCLWLYDALLTS